MAPLINFSGIASGIDSASLIEALLDRERAVRISPLEDTISRLQDTNDAFSELKGLLANLQTAAGRFRTVNGGILSKTASSSDESVVTASASNLAQNGTYSINVTQLAKSSTFSFASTAGTYTSSSAKISDGSAFSDTVNVSIGTGASQEVVTIDVDETTTLEEFVSEFNSEADGAVASIVNTGTSSSPDYRIVINSSSTGTEEGSISVSVGATLSGRGAFDSNAIDDAEDAEFTIGGISGTITRSSNTVSDILGGVTLNLSSLGSSTVSISNDSSASASTMQEFVDAYNEVITFINENDLITQEGEGDDLQNIFGPLASSSLDENIVSSIRSAFSSSSISGGLVNTLADLGIATERDGTLSFDSNAFTEAISTDADSVLQITTNLGETLAAVDGTIAQFSQYNGLIDLASTSNQNQISGLESRISDLEAALSLQEETLTKRFSRLEALIGQLNSQQSTLAQLLPR